MHAAALRDPTAGVYFGRLFTFLPGQVTSASALTAKAIWSFGQVTARLGRALRGFLLPAPVPRSCAQAGPTV
jgi:Ser/Thr protein kinase RdoA (MazF antagonist)